MLKIQVTEGIMCLGNDVASVKLIYRMRRTLSAENPCKAVTNNMDEYRSKLSLVARRRRAVSKLVASGLGEPFAVEWEADAKIYSYSRRIEG